MAGKKKDAEAHEAVKAALLAAMTANDGADIVALRVAVGLNVPAHLVSIRKVHSWTDRVLQDLETSGVVVRDGERWRIR